MFPLGASAVADGECLAPVADSRKPPGAALAATTRSAGCSDPSRVGTVGIAVWAGVGAGVGLNAGVEAGVEAVRGALGAAAARRSDRSGPGDEG